MKSSERILALKGDHVCAPGGRDRACFFQHKNEDYLRYFKAIILGHNDQYLCGTSPRLNKESVGKNP